MQSISARASEREEATMCYTKVCPPPSSSQGSLWHDPHTKATLVPAVPLGTLLWLPGGVQGQHPMLGSQRLP